MAAGNERGFDRAGSVIGPSAGAREASGSAENGREHVLQLDDDEHGWKGGEGNGSESGCH